jgi:hypothetical protein
MVKAPKAQTGLRGQDKKQGSLRDTRGGTYDPASETGAKLPEGLARKRKGPLSKTRGRR